MPHKALNRIVVRMLYDPKFQEEVYLRPRDVMDPLGIPVGLQDSLLQNDRRAWNLDTQRRKRSLQGLMEEFPCSSTLVLAHTKSLSTLDSFFSSDIFHKCIQNRGSMPLSFIEYLSSLGKGEPLQENLFKDILALEAAKATVRRAHSAPKAELKIKEVVCQPGVLCGSFTNVTIDNINIIEEYLYELSLIPAIALCNDKPDFPQLKESKSKAPFFLMLQPKDGDIAISPVSIVIHDALNLLQKPLTESRFLGLMQNKGLKAQSANQLLSSLIQQNLVRSAS